MMLADVWLLIEQSAPAAAMRGSIWLYPLINVIHFLGLLAFFAAVAAMDVRLLGGSARFRWRQLCVLAGERPRSR